MRDVPRSHMRGLDEKICSAFAPKLVRNIERSRNISCNRSVDSDADAAIFPGGNFRWRGRFRTILIGGVKCRATSVLFVRHSLRLSGCKKVAAQSFVKITLLIG